MLCRKSVSFGVFLNMKGQFMQKWMNILLLCHLHMLLDTMVFRVQNKNLSLEKTLSLCGLI